jgi:predicted RNA-binding Zn-ribbon protein involved in translation (DUF1610 family)
MQSEEKTRLIKHLEEKWTSQKCPMCGKSAWNVPSEIYELRELNGGGLVVGPIPLVPVIPITCANCGNTVLVNAIVAGITKRDAENDDV